MDKPAPVNAIKSGVMPRTTELKNMTRKKSQLHRVEKDDELSA